MNGQMMKAAIFDLDGTLLESMGVWRSIDVRFLGRRGLTLTPDYLEAITPLGFEAAARYTIDRFGLREEPQAIMDEWYRMAKDEYAHRVDLKPHAREYLEQLRCRGIRMGVATSSEWELFEPTLIRTGIRGYFSEIVTVRDVKRGKGFPDIYEAAADGLGAKPGETVVFEDILKGIQGAKDGGFRTVGVYDRHSAGDEEAIRKLADVFIHDFQELLEEKA